MCIAAGLLLAWLAARPSGPATPVGTIIEPGPALPGPDTQPVSPEGLLQHPLAGTGLEPLSALPPDLPVPQGARKLYGFRQQLPDGQTDSFAFLLAGNPPAVQEFYRTRLPEIGYKLMNASPGLRQGGVTMVFTRGAREQCALNIHPADKNGQTKFVLLMTRLGAGGTSRPAAG